MVKAVFIQRDTGTVRLVLHAAAGQPVLMDGDGAWLDFSFMPFSSRLGRTVSWQDDPEEWARSLPNAYADSPLWVEATDELTYRPAPAGQRLPGASPRVLTSRARRVTGAVARGTHAAGNHVVSVARWLERAGVPRLAVGALALLTLSTLYFASASQLNRSAVTGWKARSGQLTHALAARNQELAHRNISLNTTAGELAGLNHEVTALEVRQRALANEKAQVEDQNGLIKVEAAELAKLAKEQRACSNGLAEVLTHAENGDTAWLTSNGASVSALCQTAQTAFSALQAQAQ